MNDKLIRVHLRQAVLVVYGTEARYAKVLCGQHDPVMTERWGGVPFMSMIVIGYIHSYTGVNLATPTRMLLATNNILVIEDAKVEHAKPTGVIVPCTRVDYHPAHESTMANMRCPGMRRIAEYHATAYPGTPETLWVGAGQHQVKRNEVQRATRIIQLCKDGTYRIVKNREDGDFDPKNEVIFLYKESS